MQYIEMFANNMGRALFWAVHQRPANCVVDRRFELVLIAGFIDNPLHKMLSLQTTLDENIIF